MAFRRPLVIVDGIKSELPVGDQIASNTYAPAGGGNSGWTFVDFGANGSDTAQTDITGQTGITVDSSCHAEIACKWSDDHSPDEHFIEEIEIRAGGAANGVGFTIYARTRNGLLFGKYNVFWSWR